MARLKDLAWASNYTNKPGHVVVPHPRKDMPLGTLRSIFRQAGWDWR